MAVEDLLECDLAIQLGVERDEDDAQTTLGVRPQDSEPLAVGGCRSKGVAGGFPRVALVSARRAGHSGESFFNIRAASAGEALACRLLDVQGGQTAFGIAAMPPQVAFNEGIEKVRSVESSRLCRTSISPIFVPGEPVQAPNAATNSSRVIIPFCRASNPNKSSRGTCSAGAIGDRLLARVIFLFYQESRPPRAARDANLGRLSF